MLSIASFGLLSPRAAVRMAVDAPASSSPLDVRTIGDYNFDPLKLGTDETFVPFREAEMKCGDLRSPRCAPARAGCVATVFLYRQAELSGPTPGGRVRSESMSKFERAVLLEDLALLRTHIVIRLRATLQRRTCVCPSSPQHRPSVPCPCPLASYGSLWAAVGRSAHSAGWWRRSRRRPSDRTGADRGPRTLRQQSPPLLQL